MSIGWFKLHRKLIDSRVFANEGLLRLWIYCLCRANHEKNYVDIYTGKGKTEVEINAGEFIFGRNVVAKELKMNPSTLYKRMQKLETIGNINIKSNTHYSIVSICNWKVYQRKKKKKKQPKEQPSNNQVTGKEQPSNTDKNVNNANNEKNIYSDLIFDYKNIQKMEQPLTVEQGEKLIEDFGIEAVEDVLMNMENWKNLKNNLSTNLTVRNWMKRRTKNDDLDARLDKIIGQ